MKKLLVALLIVWWLALGAIAQADSAVTGEDILYQTGNTAYMEIDWIADTDGSVDDTITVDLAGWYLEQIITDPGSPAPDIYNLTFEDANGIPYTGGALASRSATEVEIVWPKDSNNMAGSILLRGPITIKWTGNDNNGAEGKIIFNLSKKN